MAIAPDTTGSTPITVAATSASIDITAAAVGAWVYLWCDISTGTGTLTGVPSNASWTTVTSNASTGNTCAIYRRQKQSGDTTFSFTWATNSGKGVFSWSSYTGLNSSTPDERAAIALNDVTSRAAVPTPSATPTAANRWALAFFAQHSSTSTQKPTAWTPDAALVQRIEADNSASGSAPWHGTDIEDSNGAVTQAAHSYTATSNQTEQHDGSGILFLIPAAGTVSGTVQPPPTVPVPRRKPARVLWQRITGQAFVKVPAPGQQPRPAPRRTPARAYVQFKPVKTTNAVPAPPVSGTVQPKATVPVPRRQPARALWRGITGAAYVKVPAPAQQPRTLPRRTPARVLWRGNAVPGTYGTAPAQQYRTPPRRILARAIWRGITGHGPAAIPAPVQQYRTAPRRILARALWRSGAVPTTNTPPHRTLLISLASQAGTDDYGNSYPQGILATAGVIEGPQFVGADFVIDTAGAFFYSGTPAAGNLVASVVPGSSGGIDGFGNNYLAGTASYAATFATALNAGFVAFYAGSLAGGWGTALSSVAGDVAGNLQVNATGQLQLVGSAGVAITGSFSVNGSTSTGAGDNGGVTSGPSGTVTAFPAAGPNHTHSEFHHHPL